MNPSSTITVISPTTTLREVLLSPSAIITRSFVARPKALQSSWTVITRKDVHFVQGNTESNQSDFKIRWVKRRKVFKNWERNFEKLRSKRKMMKIFQGRTKKKLKIFFKDRMLFCIENRPVFVGEVGRDVIKPTPMQTQLTCRMGRKFRFTKESKWFSCCERNTNT